MMRHGTVPFVSLAFIALAFLNAACSPGAAGPSQKQVTDDWNSYVAEANEDCSQSVKFSSAKVVGTSVEGVAAEVILHVSGDWIRKYEPGFFFEGPCKDFRKAKGSHQGVERHLRYKRFDTGWRLENVD